MCLWANNIILFAKTKCICGICPWAVTYISYNVLQDSATYADMYFLSYKTRWQGRRRGDMKYVLRVWLCMSRCVGIKWVTDRQKIDGKHCIFFAISLFSEDVCVLRNMPKITWTTHDAFFFSFFSFCLFVSALCRKFNVYCCVLLLKPLCVSLYSTCLL